MAKGMDTVCEREKKSKANWNIIIWDLLSTYYCKPETHLENMDINITYLIQEVYVLIECQRWVLMGQKNSIRWAPTTCQAHGYLIYTINSPERWALGSFLLNRQEKQD